MTNIGSVDKTAQPRQQSLTAQRAEDFARELAKHEAQEKSQQQAQDKAGEQSKPATQNSELAAVHIDAQQPTSAPRAGLASMTNESSQATWAAKQTTIVQEQALADVVVAPTGLTEAILSARVYGWHARGQAYLSELSLAEEQVEPLAEKIGRESFPNETPIEEPAGEAASRPAPIETEKLVSAQAATAAGNATQDSGRVSSDDAAPAGAKEVAESNASLAGYWTERSLRFTRQQDGSSVAWLRDFRITSAEAPRLVALALSDAKAKGLKLSRIMLNGQEAWSSSNGK
jgi:hypothetical protein